MTADLQRFKKPRCFLVYALAPDDLSTREANRVFNDFVADRSLPLVLYHDHFTAPPGGFAIFYVASQEERDALLAQQQLEGWHVEYRPLTYSGSPVGLDGQIAWTLEQYRGLDWEKVRREEHPQ